MDNAVIIDLILAAVLLLFAAFGAWKGLMRSLMLLVSTALALVGAALLSAALAEPAAELVFPKVEESVVAQLEQLLPGAADGGLLPDGTFALPDGAEEELRRFGISAETITGALDGAEASVRAAVERAAYLLVKAVVQAVLFLLLFVALLLLLRLLTRALDAVCSLPVLRTVNAAGGALLSLCEGALLIFLVLSLAPRLGVSWFADHADGTRLLAWFMNNTPNSILASLT